MDIGDLLLVIAVIITGVLSLAYIVFVVGSQGKCYTLTCPPCEYKNIGNKLVVTTGQPTVSSTDNSNPPIVAK